MKTFFSNVDVHHIVLYIDMFVNGVSDGILNSSPYPDKALKDSLDRVLLSGYFDKAQSHQNGVCEEEEEDEEQQLEAVVESAEEQTVDQGQHFWHWR